MRRRAFRPYGSTVGPLRLLSLLMAVGLLWVLYDRFKDPTTWRWMTGEKPVVQIAGVDMPEPAEKPEAPPKVEESVVPGPNDLDEQEREAIRPALEVVRDRTTLQGREMLAYWRVMKWASTESFADLWKRAANDVATTQLWEQPEKYRAKPVRMTLHVIRALEYDAPKTEEGNLQNDLGMKSVIECWGATDESRSIPYCVVLYDPPAGLKLGTEVHYDLHFVGYFLKNMSYQTFDGKGRSAPVFVGRGKLKPSAKPAAIGPKLDPMVLLGLAALGGAIVIGVVFLGSRGRGKRIKAELGVLPDALPDFNAPPEVGNSHSGKSGGAAIMDDIDLTGSGTTSGPNRPAEPHAPG